MALDTAHLWQLLDEVANTSGHASARKSEELLNYVTDHVGGKDAVSTSTTVGTTETADGKSSDEHRTDER